MPDTVTASPSANIAAAKPPRASFLRRTRHLLAPLLWVGPAVALIAIVVLWPVVIMFRTSFRNIDSIGFDHGWAGLVNFKNLFREPDLESIFVRTVVWVLAIVVITVFLSLALAQLFNQKFPGRRITRWALIAPWAASVFMTAVVFRWMLDSNSGMINVFLHDIGVLHKFGSNEADWLGRPTAALWWMIAVAVFVSVPFTTYAILAGLQTIPPDLYEASRVDGASVIRTYVSITLPLLRPALLVATLINVMNVFNSFPIIWAMTRGGPGHQTATTTIFMYLLKGSSIPESAALSVLNFGLVIIIVLAFLKVSNWKSQVN